MSMAKDRLDEALCEKYPEPPEGFVKGQKIRVLMNPYAPMMESPAAGDIGTITESGIYIVGVKFGGKKFKAWVAVDGNGKATIESI